jgi:cleavage and polyadenylation specificity factor subunit 1
MASLYGVVRDSHPPTCVHCSTSGYFRDLEELCLVVAKGNSLDVYAMRTSAGNEDKEEDAAEGSRPISSTTPNSAKLELLGRYDLFGIVESMEFVRFPGRPRERLLLAFRDAKLAVIEYDPEVDGVRTVALHYYEEESLRKGRVSFDQPPILRIDNLRRCAALLIYECKLVVIPFQHQVSVLCSHISPVECPCPCDQNDFNCILCGVRPQST